jgi:hypothetical protein
VGRLYCIGLNGPRDSVTLIVYCYAAVKHPNWKQHYAIPCLYLGICVNYLCSKSGSGIDIREWYLFSLIVVRVLSIVCRYAEVSARNRACIYFAGVVI